MSDRSRSASPVREEPKPKKQKTAGFKWKDKKARDEDTNTAQASRDSGRLQRGYRDRSPRRDSYRDRDADRSRHGGRDEDRARDRSPPRRGGGTDNYRPSSDARSGDARIADPLDGSASEKRERAPKDPAKPAKKEKKPKAPVSNEPMIVVNINDRLGTKAAIPCLASDSIKAFKAVVAAHIGRQPHEIMLKRQGERPFKDQLTLEDYGVSSGVQLDLELDTGD